MILEFIIITTLSLAVSLILNRVMLNLGPRLGLMDEPGARRIHVKPIPRAGGIAIWLTFLLVTAGVLVSGGLVKTGSLSIPWLNAFAAGSAVLMAAGFMDDRSGLSPLVKLGAHLLAPTVFFFFHPVQTGILPASWPIGYHYLLFMVWAVLLINAFNLIDGLDGLCGGLAAVSTFALAGLALTNGRTDSALLLLVMGGAILGFLKYNLNPARIFLGDAGSMLLGFFLATAATDAVGRKAVMGVILLPIAVAGIPLLDVLLAIWRRSMRHLVRQMSGEKINAGIFTADSDHLHHRLLGSGGSQRKVARLLQGLAIVLAALAFLPLILGDQVMGLSLVGFMIVALLGIRNLARVEIEHTGRMIHLAIKLPGRRRRVAAALFIYDLLVLIAAGFAGVMIETNQLIRETHLDYLVRFVVVFTVLGSVATLIVQVHHRLWVRATIRDVISLQLWLLAAAVGTFTLFSLTFANLEWSVLRLTVISYVLGCAGICLPRVMVDILREFGLDARHRKSRPGESFGQWPVVVLGAGDLGTLFLDHLKSSAHDFYPGMRVLGFIDESRALQGRRLRSFRILGGLSIVPELVEKEGLKGIVVAIRRPDEKVLEALDTLADAHSLKIYRWKAELEEK